MIIGILIVLLFIISIFTFILYSFTRTWNMSENFRNTFIADLSVFGFFMSILNVLLQIFQAVTSTIYKIAKLI